MSDQACKVFLFCLGIYMSAYLIFAFFMYRSERK